MVRCHFVYLILFTNLLCWHVVSASSEVTALSGSFLLLCDPTSGFITPLAGADTDRISVSLTHGNRYQVSGLSAAELAAVFPFPGGIRLITGFRRFGGASYSEDRALLAVCRPFGDQWYGAVSLRYGYTRFGTTDAISKDVGAAAAVKYKAGKEIDIGFQVSDLFTNEEHVHRARESPVVTVSCEYHPGKVRVAVSIEKQPEYMPSVITSVRYSFSDRFCIMSGASTGPSTLGFGFMVTFGKWNITCAGSLHRVLGVSRDLTINLTI